MIAKQLLKVVLAGVAIAAAWGQAPSPPIPYDPFAQVKQFLGLTADQSSKLDSIQTQYQLLAQNKLARVGQVNQEIDQETAKPSLDAAALGVRYLELEVICREMQSAAAGIPVSSLAVLTDPQKIKLKQLEDASKLAPAISQAQTLGLLPGPGLGSARWFDTTGFTIAFPQFSFYFPGCRSSTGGRVALIPFSQTEPSKQQ